MSSKLSAVVVYDDEDDRKCTAPTPSAPAPAPAVELGAMCFVLNYCFSGAAGLAAAIREQNALRRRIVEIEAAAALARVRAQTEITQLQLQLREEQQKYVTSFLLSYFSRTYVLLLIIHNKLDIIGLF